ncbi:hypothetical protein CJF31_00011922 [Rutstroemia sp. NJR-2017a BVV2]|nr:hypothetical protein CJF31_00011922 [Rutstroemia sp. NJR-2017a BVV2]
MIPSSSYRVAGLCITIFILTYLLWSPATTFVSHTVAPSPKPIVIEPGESCSAYTPLPSACIHPPTNNPNTHTSAIKHYLGSKDCAIIQSDLHHVPYPQKPNLSPFCKTRAQLLDALSSGGRHGFDEPYVGKSCTHRWFSTPEICTILSRFSAILFLGDEFAQTVYAALNVFLREDISHGGLQEWLMTDAERMACRCDAQYLDDGCLRYTVKNSDEVVKNEASDPMGSGYFCQRGLKGFFMWMGFYFMYKDTKLTKRIETPHAYIPITHTPAPPLAISSFQSLTYQKPDPWRPSPMILSLSQGPNLDIPQTRTAIEEWMRVAAGAERNIPVLILGPEARGGGEEAWRYMDEMRGIAKEMNIEVLGLWNLTVQAGSMGEGNRERYGGRVKLVEAMMVVNWLAKLETS